MSAAETLAMVRAMMVARSLEICLQDLFNSSCAYKSQDMQSCTAANTSVTKHVLLHPFWRIIALFAGIFKLAQRYSSVAWSLPDGDSMAL